MPSLPILANARRRKLPPIRIIPEIFGVGKGPSAAFFLFEKIAFDRRFVRAVACGTAFFAYNEGKRGAKTAESRRGDVGDEKKRRGGGVATRRRDRVRVGLSAFVLDLRRAERFDADGRRIRRRFERVSRSVVGVGLRGLSSGGERSGADVLPSLRAGRASGNGAGRRRVVSALSSLDGGFRVCVRRSASAAFLSGDDPGSRVAIEEDARTDVGGDCGASLF